MPLSPDDILGGIKRAIDGASLILHLSDVSQCHIAKLQADIDEARVRLTAFIEANRIDVSQTSLAMLVLLHRYPGDIARAVLVDFVSSCWRASVSEIVGAELPATWNEDMTDALEPIQPLSSARHRHVVFSAGHLYVRATPEPNGFEIGDLSMAVMVAHALVRVGWLDNHAVGWRRAVAAELGWPIAQRLADDALNTRFNERRAELRARREGGGQ